MSIITYYGLILCDIQVCDLRMEINQAGGIDQYAITMITHYDVTMSNDVAMCTYHGITMHNDVTMNLFYYVFSSLCLIMILLWVVCNKIKNKFMFDQSDLENTFVVFV